MLSLSGFGHNRWSGHEPCPARAIGDGFHSATAAANLYLHTHPATANDLLITSSAIIDLLTLFLLWLWIFRGMLRPFLGLVIVLGLRQIMQAWLRCPRRLAGSGIILAFRLYW